MKNSIDALYFIVLKDNLGPWDKLQQAVSSQFPKLPVHRIDAVDTRTIDTALAALDKHGFRLTPVGESNHFYFSEALGATGCYLSHYLCWEHILANKYDNALVLESDSLLEDVLELLENPLCITDHDVSDLDFMQLNLRQPIPGLNKEWELQNPGEHLDWRLMPKFAKEIAKEQGPAMYRLEDLGPRYCESHDGTESYLATSSAAKSFIDITRHPTKLRDAPFLTRGGTRGPAGWPFKRVTYDKAEWDVGGDDFKICCPVDKLIGYMHALKLLKGGYSPTIQLDRTNESQIFSNFPLRKHMIRHAQSSKSWKWWE